MSISTQVPATRGVSTGKHRTSKQAEFAAAVRDRLGRLTKPPADDSPPDSCDEVVDTRTGEPCEDTVPDGRADGAVAGWLGLRGARTTAASTVPGRSWCPSSATSCTPEW
jgi:hypothetical protein